MKQVIHETDMFKLVLERQESAAGVTGNFFTVWPQANHPEPHRLLQLTLPKEGWLRLAEFAKECAE